MLVASTKFYKKFLFVIVLVFFLFLPVFRIKSADLGQECISNLDCSDKPNLVCEKGVCKGDLDFVGCNKDSDCAFGLICDTNFKKCKIDIGQKQVGNLGLPEAGKDIRDTIMRFVNYFLSFLGIIGVSIVIYGGLVWMTAGGNQERIDKAKKIIINGLIGIVIILFSWTIVSYVISILSGRIPGQGDRGSGPGSGLPPGEHPPIKEIFKIIRKTPLPGQINVPTCAIVEAEFNDILDEDSSFNLKLKDSYFKIFDNEKNKFYEIDKINEFLGDNFIKPDNLLEGRIAKKAILKNKKGSLYSYNLKDSNKGYITYYHLGEEKGEFNKQTIYEVEIKNNIKSAKGKSLDTEIGKDFVNWKFKTGSKSDSENPFIEDYYPKGDEVCLNANIQIRFNEVMLGSSLRVGKINVSCTFNNEKKEIEILSKRIKDIGPPFKTILELILKENLPENSVCTVDVSKADFKDLCGLPLDCSKNSCIWSFNTGNIDTKCKPYIDLIAPLENYYSENEDIIGRDFSLSGDIVVAVYNNDLGKTDKEMLNNLSCFNKENWFEQKNCSILWSNSSINFEIPFNQISGEIYIKANDFDSNKKYLKILNPYIKEVEFVEDLNGNQIKQPKAPLTILGFNFGERTEKDKVLFRWRVGDKIEEKLAEYIDSDYCKIDNIWNDYQIIVKFPKELPNNKDIYVQVIKNINGKNRYSNKILVVKKGEFSEEEYQGPILCQIKPNSGKKNTEIFLGGENLKDSNFVNFYFDEGENKGKLDKPQISRFLENTEKEIKFNLPEIISRSLEDKDNFLLEGRKLVRVQKNKFVSNPLNFWAKIDVFRITFHYPKNNSNVNGDSIIEIRFSNQLSKAILIKDETGKLIGIDSLKIKHKDSEKNIKGEFEISNDEKIVYFYPETEVKIGNCGESILPKGDYEVRFNCSIIKDKSEEPLNCELSEDIKNFEGDVWGWEFSSNGNLSKIKNIELNKQYILNQEEIKTIRAIVKDDEDRIINRKIEKWEVYSVEPVISRFIKEDKNLVKQIECKKFVDLKGIAPGEDTLLSEINNIQTTAKIIINPLSDYSDSDKIKIINFAPKGENVNLNEKGLVAINKNVLNGAPKIGLKVYKLYDNSNNSQIEIESEVDKNRIYFYPKDTYLKELNYYWEPDTEYKIEILPTFPSDKIDCSILEKGDFGCIYKFKTKNINLPQIIDYFPKHSPACINSEVLVLISSDLPLEGDIISEINEEVEIETLYLGKIREIKFIPKNKDKLWEKNKEYIVKLKKSTIKSKKGRIKNCGILEEDGEYCKFSFSTGGDICKIQEIGIAVFRGDEVPSLDFKNQDEFTCKGQNCIDDLYPDKNFPEKPGNQHLYTLLAYDRFKNLVALEDIEWEIENKDILELVDTYQTNAKEGTVIWNSKKSVDTKIRVLAKPLGLNSERLYKSNIKIIVKLCPNLWIYKDFSSPAGNFKLEYCTNIDDEDPAKVIELTNFPLIAPKLSEDNIKHLIFTVGYPEDKFKNEKIGILIFKNLLQESIPAWLKSKGNMINVNKINNIDVWQAYKAENSVYINFANVSENVIYPNIFVISVNKNASNELKQIFKEIIENLKFNINISNDLDKIKLARDYQRILDLKLITKKLKEYKKIYNTYPKLEAGTLMKNITTSLWDSWILELGNLLNLSTEIPKDPINEIICSERYDEKTCFNKSLNKYECLIGSRFYNYEYNNKPNIFANLEYKDCTWWKRSGVVSDEMCIQMKNPACEIPEGNPFNMLIEL